MADESKPAASTTPANSSKQPPQPPTQANPQTDVDLQTFKRNQEPIVHRQQTTEKKTPTGSQNKATQK